MDDKVIDPNEKVHVIVNERPNRVWVVFRDKIHAGRWRTVNPGENGIKDITEGSNASLLNAAMYSWDGQDFFSTTYGELVERSGGWGVQWE